MPEERHLPTRDRKSVRLFLCGDVMCGRGIDQVLAHPCSSEIDHAQPLSHLCRLGQRAVTFAMMCPLRRTLLVDVG